MFWSRHDTIYLISHLPKGSVLNSYDSPSLAVIFFFHYNSSLFTLSVATDPPSITTSLKPCVPPPAIYVTGPLVKKINTISSF